MFLDPLAQTIQVYNEISEDYASRWFKYSDLQPFVEKFLDSLPASGSILDAGCGCGREIHFLSRKRVDDLLVDCVGIDLSFGLIKEARKRVPHAAFRVMDLRKPEFPDSIFSGLLCFAVWNHFFEEDIFDALVAFRRILRPDGIVAITLKTGVGHEIDAFGRLTKYYQSETIVRFLKEYGFSIEHEHAEERVGGGGWLQILARNQKTSDPASDRNCAFCPPSLLPQNRIEQYPVAGSILWGDRDIFCTVDCAPLVEGHLLLITSKHHYSYMSSDIAYSKILEHKEFARTVLEEAYGVPPTFAEHGTIAGGSGSASCIEHAHLHALPLKRDIKKIIKERAGELIAYRDNEIIRGILGSKAYILYEDQHGEIFVKSDGVQDIESQFFRIVVGIAQKIDNPKWGASIHDSMAKARYQRTLTKLVPVLDKFQIQKPIFSRITETRQARIFSERPYERGQKSSAAISELRKRIEPKLTLLDLGEKEITEQLIYKVFDRQDRKSSVLGDDAAVVPLSTDASSIVVTTDACPEPIIFSFEPANYHYYGWLSLVVSVSDLAAMGAEPLGAVVACEMPEKMKVHQFLDFLEGVAWAAERFQCPIVGGNIKDARRFNAVTTAFGTTKERKPLKRLGAAVGDGVYAIGNMGYLWAGILNKYNKLVVPPWMLAALETALTFPSPNLAGGLYLSNLGIVGACMDASDGPTGALMEIAEKNHVDIIIHTSLLKPAAPVAEIARQLNLNPKTLMLTWGNWELIFTADPEALKIRTRDHPMKDEIARLGTVVKGSGVVKMSNGKILPDLSSRRFAKSSSFSHGLQGYLSLIGTTKI